MRIAFLTLALFIGITSLACDGDDDDAIPDSTPTSTATVLSDDGLLRLYDFQAGVWVTEIDGLGRIPLGVANPLLIDRAHARLGPGPTVVFSLTIGAPLDEFVDPAPPVGALIYEWTLQFLEHTATVRLAPSDGLWVVTVDGEEQDSVIRFGDRELSVRVPRTAFGFADVSPTDGVSWSARTIRECSSCDVERLGDRYPRDGSAVPLIQY